MNELDKNKLFPDQRSDNMPTECVGITVADVVGNLLGFPCSPDFSYAAGFKAAGEDPTLAGEDPDAGTDGAIAFGALPASDETFTALAKGEQYVMQFQNYPPEQLKIALGNAQNGKMTLYSFDDIWSYLGQKKGGVVLPITFYSSFFNVGLDGLLPVPSGTTSEHCTAAYDTDTFNNVRGLWVKMWLGKDYGAGGYVWLSEPTFNMIFYGRAFAFNPDANRFISLLVITVKQFPWFLSFLPSIISNSKS